MFLRTLLHNCHDKDSAEEINNDSWPRDVARNDASLERLASCWAKGGRTKDMNDPTPFPPMEFVSRTGAQAQRNTRCTEGRELEGSLIGERDSKTRSKFQDNSLAINW